MGFTRLCLITYLKIGDYLLTHQWFRLFVTFGRNETLMSMDPDENIERLVIHVAQSIFHALTGGNTEYPNLVMLTRRGLFRLQNEPLKKMYRCYDPQ